MSVACPHCRALVEDDERFCTRCGAAVPRELEPVEVSEAHVRTGGWPRRAKVTLGALAVALALATAGAILLGLELSATIDEQEQTEAWLAATEDELAGTKEELHDAESLSSRRKTVLQQTDSVLAQVDPLLTSVDRMKAITNRMTETQTSFAGNAALVVSSLATLLDYVVGTSPLYWDLPYIYDLLDDVESGASAAGADQDRFESLESQYQGASRTFGQRATRYVRAVERLDKQLTKVTE